MGNRLAKAGMPKTYGKAHTSRQDLQSTYPVSDLVGAFLITLVFLDAPP